MLGILIDLTCKIALPLSGRKVALLDNKGGTNVELETQRNAYHLKNTVLSCYFGERGILSLVELMVQLESVGWIITQGIF